MLNRASAVRTSIYTRGYSDLVPGSRRMFVVLIQSSALTRAMSNGLLQCHWLVAQDNNQWQCAKDTRMVSARQRPIMLLSLAHRVLNIISLIIDRGHIQYIEFTAGYYHFVLTPR